MKQFLLAVPVLLSVSTTAHGQGTVLFENYSINPSVVTAFPPGPANGTYTVSLWYLAGASSVPTNIAQLQHDQFNNVVAGGALAVVADGYVRVSPYLTVAPGSEGIFDYGSFVTLSGVTPGENAVLAVMGWTGSYTSLTDANYHDAQIGAISFVNPTGGPGPLGVPAFLDGWEELGEDLLLQPYPIPEPSLLAFASCILFGLVVRRKIRAHHA
jgi:hypothetical protein